MPINISIETKIKPVAFQSLKTKGGAKKIGTDFAIDKLKTAFRESLKKIKTQILENQTEAIGTSLSALVVLDCTTISDTTAGPVCIIIPPGKLGQYNSALKAITMANKSTKEVAICTFNYTGEAGEGDRLLLDFKPTSKAATLLMLKFLNKEGGKVGVQFKVLQGKETEIKVEGEPALEATETTAAPFANEEKMLESLHRQFYEAPSEERLRELLEGMKNFQIVGKKNITIAKPILLVWKAKYQAAKKALAEPAPITDTAQETKEKVVVEKRVDSRKEGLEGKLEQMEASLESYGSVSELFELLSDCLEIRVSPQYKPALKNKALMTRFKGIRSALSEMFKNEAHPIVGKLKEELSTPGTMKERFEKNLKQMFVDFESKSKIAPSYTAIEDETKTLQAEILVFQKTIEAEAKGMLEGAKLLKMPNVGKISQNSTALRHKIVAVKEDLKERLAVLAKRTKVLVELEAKFLASKDKEEQKKIYEQISEETAEVEKASQIQVSIFA